LQGSNLRQILNSAFIEFSQTVSNNVREIYDMLGIEATREFLIEESKLKLLDGRSRCNGFG